MTSSDWKNALQKVKVAPAENGQLTEDEFLSFEDIVPVKGDALQRTLQRTLSELEELVRENRWDDVLAVAYPVEEKVPELVESGLDSEVRAKTAFALGQLMRFDDAIQELSLGGLKRFIWSVLTSLMTGPGLFPRPDHQE